MIDRWTSASSRTEITKPSITRSSRYYVVARVDPDVWTGRYVYSGLSKVGPNQRRRPPGRRNRSWTLPVQIDRYQPVRKYIMFVLFFKRVFSYPLRHTLETLVGMNWLTDSIQPETELGSAMDFLGTCDQLVFVSISLRILLWNERDFKGFRKDIIVAS